MNIWVHDIFKPSPFLKLFSFLYCHRFPTISYCDIIMSYIEIEANKNFH